MPVDGACSRGQNVLESLYSGRGAGSGGLVGRGFPPMAASWVAAAAKMVVSVVLVEMVSVVQCSRKSFLS